MSFRVPPPTSTHGHEVEQLDQDVPVCQRLNGVVDEQVEGPGNFQSCRRKGGGRQRERGTERRRRTEGRSWILTIKTNSSTPQLRVTMIG